MTLKDLLLQELETADDELITQTIDWLRSHKRPTSEATPSSGTWKDIHTFPTPVATEDWTSVLQQIQTPPSPQALAQLLQSWEDNGDEQEQQETWEFLRHALDHNIALAKADTDFDSIRAIGFERWLQNL
jgi:hypothetical protein